MNDIARFPIYPGFHSMPTIMLTLNLDIWKKLPQDLREILQKNVIRFRDFMVEEHKKLDVKAVAEAKAKGIEIISWPEEVAKFREIAKTQWPKWSNSPTAKAWTDAVAAYWESQK